ncbi:MAG: hypothetical protein JW801_00225 [Bacteroidales bacterium]|nr:hypothetical protein [Bacteroidales bacterium]
MKRRYIFLLLALFLLAAKASLARESFFVTGTSSTQPGLPVEMPFDIPDLFQTVDNSQNATALEHEDDGTAEFHPGREFFRITQQDAMALFTNRLIGISCGIVLLDLDLPPPTRFSC